MPKKSIVITGATGLIGSELLNHSAFNDYKIIAIVRSKLQAKLFTRKNNLHFFIVKDISTHLFTKFFWKDVFLLIHLAAIVHQSKRSDRSSKSEYKKINTDLTMNLANQAAKNFVKRFIFLSSIKVNGEFSYPFDSFSAMDECNPNDLYGNSKMISENKLLSLSKKNSMEVTIIRSPLVYGPGVKSNFLDLIKLANSGFFLPFKLINNKRSMIYVKNLVDFIIFCSNNPKTANKILMVSDFKDISTTYLLERLYLSLGKSNRLYYIPIYLLKFLFVILGKRELIYKLLYSLQANISFTKDTLKWKPPYSFEEGIEKTIKSFLKDLK